MTGEILGDYKLGDGWEQLDDNKNVNILILVDNASKHIVHGVPNINILILMDNASRHIVHGVPRTMIVVFEAFVLSNIACYFFLANVTLVVQLCVKE